MQALLMFNEIDSVKVKIRIVIHRNDKLKQKRNSCELENNK